MDQALHQDAYVKEISIGNGCIHVELFSGLCLSGPLRGREEAAPKTDRPRKMIVSGHEGMVGEALGMR
ncbi:hypothetical protein [Massilia yuzhufengensis]|uniref:Uncharacterized protein n=1 Tax=Massilia yuzhufengensis TaxID=1164594 RepID=A0A1I1P3B1_9BURK|nr:hypothetical protein [Massilia yuzhufengensis]SFD01463.1 hypothetical protein SAMN05216204_11448 [Massilia yuzhufengensis]